MASVTAPLLAMTFEQFEAEYGYDSRYEYWFGRAVERSSPTIVHGLLQKIILTLLDRTGYTSASEVELRVVSQAHPRPDVIAWKGKLGGTYPTKGLGVVVEILSENDRATNIRDHCQRYQEWGFEHIYLVEPFDRSVVEWRNGARSCLRAKVISIRSASTVVHFHISRLLSSANARFPKLRLA